MAGGVDFADDVVSGLCEVEIAGGVKYDGGGEEERDGESGDLSDCVERWGAKEQEEQCDPQWSVIGARRGCDALRTHEEIGPNAICCRFDYDAAQEAMPKLYLMDFD